MKPARRNHLTRFVGRYAVGVYPAPAISCCWNGRMIRVAGRITRVAQDGMGQLGVVIERTVLHPDEIHCPSLKWTGRAYRARTG